MNLRPLVAAGLALCSGLAIATNADAAPAPTCVSATMTPSAAAFPANLPAFGYTATTATAKDVHLYAVGPTRTELPLTVGPEVVDGYVKVTPASPLVAGTAYELEFSPFCSYGAYPSVPLSFTPTAEAPLPTKLGELTSGPTVTLTDYGTTQVAIKATYTVAAEMKPWASVYLLGMMFDGQVVETHPTFSGDSVQIDASAWCDDAASKTNKHTMQLRARLPFAPTVETTSAPIEFVCPAPRITTAPDNGAVKPPVSSGTSGTSAGSTSTAGGCSTSPGAPSSAASFGLLLAVAALVRRARRISGGAAASTRT